MSLLPFTALSIFGTNFNKDFWRDDFGVISFLVFVRTIVDSWIYVAGFFFWCELLNTPLEGPKSLNLPPPPLEFFRLPTCLVRGPKLYASLWNEFTFFLIVFFFHSQQLKCQNSRKGWTTTNGCWDKARTTRNSTISCSNSVVVVEVQVAEVSVEVVAVEEVAVDRETIHRHTRWTAEGRTITITTITIIHRRIINSSPITRSACWALPQPPARPVTCSVPTRSRWPGVDLVPDRPGPTTSCSERSPRTATDAQDIRQVEGIGTWKNFKSLKLLLLWTHFSVLYHILNL